MLNAALSLNHDRRRPVRVIRRANGDPTFSPDWGYRYDGLFNVDDYWQEAGTSRPAFRSGGSDW
ncbi:YDG/SRA domain-containing protein [Capillimicrobium parvum]|uniref:YDG/SRA domain-containing protein n=1 Tax=Capillimicrobium parvum TaxID=2884022 RepID=UPI0038996101